VGVGKGKVIFLNLILILEDTMHKFRHSRREHLIFGIILGITGMAAIIEIYRNLKK